MRSGEVLSLRACEREVADRKDMRSRIVRFSVPAPIAERIKLLHIAEIEPGLLFHPGSEADLERALRARSKRTEGKRVPTARRTRFWAYHENLRLPVLHRDDRRIQSKFDLGVGPRRARAAGVAHIGQRGVAGRTKTRPSSANCPRPMLSTA